MRFSNLFACILVLVGRTCLAEFRIGPSQQTSFYGLVQPVIETVKSCYGNPVHSIGLAGNLEEALVKGLWLEKSLPVTLIGEDNPVIGPLPRQFRIKLETFVVSASSAPDLDAILRNVKRSVWWNHMASFLIVDNSCANAFEFLWTAWQMDITNAKFMCFHHTKGPLIYNFNPYTKDAPRHWQVDGTWRGKHDHPWTLFVHEYRNDNSICADLDFDKTKDLGGYKIRTSFLNTYKCNSPTRRSKKKCLTNFSAVMDQLLFPALEAKSIAFLHDTFESAGFIDDKGVPHGIMADILNGRSDIGLFTRYQMPLINFTTTYPLWESGLFAITRYNGNMSQLNKIASLLDSSSKLGFYIISLTALIYFKYFQRKSLMDAVLDFFRVFLNGPLMTVPKGLAPRIYLGSLFLFLLNISGLYQGRMASLLTKQASLPNINTLEDLANFGYTIHGNKQFTRFFKDPVFEGRYVESTKANCTEHVLKKKMTACINERFIILNDAAKLTLHLTPRPIVKLYWVYQIRDDWPLERRINVILQRFVEADLMRPLHERKIRKVLQTIESNEKIGEVDQFEILTLGKLAFSFTILVIGLFVATVAFVVEISVGQNRSREMYSSRFFRNQVEPVSQIKN